MKHPCVCIIGMGRFGCALARELMSGGCRVTVVDRNEAALTAIADKVNTALIGDVTEPNLLQTLNLPHFDCIYVAVGREILPFLAVANAVGAKNMSKVRCRATNDAHRFVLRQFGIDQGLEVETLAAKQIAGELCSHEYA